MFFKISYIEYNITDSLSVKYIIVLNRSFTCNLWEVMDFHNKK